MAAFCARAFGVTASVAVAARSVTLLISRWKMARTNSASTSTNAIRPAWLTGPARYTLTTWVAVGLCVKSQASRQATPGLLPQFPVSVPGRSATRKPVAWNTELLSTSATPREATGGFAVRGCLRPCGR